MAKRTELHIKDKQGPRETFSEFLQRLAKAVLVGITDPKARQVLFESLAFKSAN